MNNIKEAYWCDTLDKLNDKLIILGYEVMEVIEILEEYEDEVIQKFDKGNKIQIKILENNKVELKLIK